MDVPQRFCVRWNSYKSNLQTAFPKLLTSEHFVDVTLACEKQFIKCHKIVLSACSVYFETLLVNNPCQHPIIFMKDVEFWEIKALVEFMYKGEVNVSQNQLDSLLKSAESLQIRGLSGTKQFVHCEQSDSGTDDNLVESKSKRNKSDNEEEEDSFKKKKKKAEDEDKCIHITSVKGQNSSRDIKLEENLDIGNQVIKEETIEQEEYEYENSVADVGEEEEEIEGYCQDEFYIDQNNDPGPSGVTDLCSIALNHVECVMDNEKVKTCTSPSTSKNSSKCQQRLQEHNYTNPPKDDTITPAKPEDTCQASSSPSNDKTKNTGPKTESAAQIKADNGTKHLTQSSSTSASERQPLELKNKVVKKDVFNRIRRSEEELQKAAEMVRGGMTFQTASDTFNIPISTIRFYMARRGILPQRRRGRGSSGVRDDDLIHPPFEIIHYRLPDIDKPI